MSYRKTYKVSYEISNSLGRLIEKLEDWLPGAVLLLLILSTTSILLLLPNINASTESKQTLIVAMIKYIKNPNPLKQETWYDWWLNLVTYDYLFRIDTNLEPKPWLCKSFKASSDGLTWTFVTVKNATWHDGIPFTVRDLAFSIEFFKKYQPSAWYPNIMYIDKVEVVNDYTVRLHLNKTFVWMVRRIGDTIILPEHIWRYVPEVFEDPYKFNPLDKDDVSKVLAVIKEKAPSDIYTKVKAFVDKYGHLRIGLGPFILTGWKEGEFIEMSKNPNYFRKGYPKVSKLIYKVYKDPQAQYLAVKKGEVHIMVWTLPYAVIEEAESDENLVVPKDPDVYVGFIGLNTKDPILNNKLVRKAIAHAINKTEIVETLMLGLAMPANTYIHPGYSKWVAKDIPIYEFNLTKATQLLDMAGFKDIDGDGIRETPEGNDVSLEILTPSYDPVRVRIGDLMVEWLSKIGIKLSNKPVDFDTLVDEVSNKHNFQLYIIESAGNFEPWFLATYYVSSQYKPGGRNPWGFTNATFNELAELSDATIDESERRELIARMQRILANEVPIIPVYIRYWIQAYRKDLKGVVSMPGGALNFWTLINAHFVEEGKEQTMGQSILSILSSNLVPIIAAVIAAIVIVIVLKRRSKMV